jgi:alpha-aminoadipic semialdehyde synthase
LPYVKHLTGQIGGSLNAQESREISESISNAKIVSLGVLTEKHQWLQPAVDQWQSSQPMNPSQPGLVGRKRVLLLGSGLVAGPGVDVFAARQDVSLCIGK